MENEIISHSVGNGQSEPVIPQIEGLDIHDLCVGTGCVTNGRRSTETLWRRADRHCRR